MARASKKNVIHLNPPDPVLSLGGDLAVIEKYHAEHLLTAGGGIIALGDIVFGYHCGDIEGLNNKDIQGIGLAIKALGQHVEDIHEHLDGKLSSMRTAVTELGGEA